MVQLDPFQGYVVCGAGSVIGAGMMALARPDEPRLRAALSTCVWAFVAIGIGLLQFLVTDPAPDWSLLLGSESAVIGTGLFGWGFARLAGARVQPKVMTLGLPAAALFVFAGYLLGLRAFACARDLACFAVGAAIVLAQRSFLLRPRNRAEFILALSLVLYTLSWLLELGFSLMPGRVPQRSLMNVPQPLATAYAIFYCVIPLIIASLVLNVLNAELHAKLRTRALTDELTGLMTRRGLHELADEVRQEAQQRGWMVAALLLDLDHFKQINDRHGHAGGDDVLRHAAALIAKSVRKDALVTRHGGEEFVVLLPAPHLDSVRRAAERLRLAIGASVCRTGGAQVRLTTSIGVAPWQLGEELGAALARADAALYRAKAGGRDRVELAA